MTSITETVACRYQLGLLPAHDRNPVPPGATARTDGSHLAVAGRKVRATSGTACSMAGDSPQANCPAPAGGRTPASIRQWTTTRGEADVDVDLWTLRHVIMDG